jgi:hypothetical protein
MHVRMRDGKAGFQCAGQDVCIVCKPLAASAKAQVTRGTSGVRPCKLIPCAAYRAPTVSPRDAHAAKVVSGKAPPVCCKFWLISHSQAHPVRRATNMLHSPAERERFPSTNLKDWGHWAACSGFGAFYGATFENSICPEFESFD